MDMLQRLHRQRQTAMVATERNLKLAKAAEDHAATLRLEHKLEGQWQDFQGGAHLILATRALEEFDPLINAKPIPESALTLARKIPAGIWGSVCAELRAFSHNVLAPLGFVSPGQRIWRVFRLTAVVLLASFTLPLGILPFGVRSLLRIQQIEKDRRKG